MTISLIRSVSLDGGASGGSSTGADFTGAQLIVAFVSGNPPSWPTFSDSQTNTWTALTFQNSGGITGGRLFYVISPSVNASQTFTLAGANSFSSALILGFSFSGTPTFDQENGNVVSESSTTTQTGSITPANSGSLLVYGCATRTSSGTPDVTAVDVGTLALHGAGAAGQRYPRGIGYEIQSSIVTRNPTFTHDDRTFRAAAIAAFYEVGGGGPWPFHLDAQSLSGGLQTLGL